MTRILDFIYFVLALLGAPVFLRRILSVPRYRHRWRERFGFVPRRRSQRSCLWIHGVSGGEIPAARRLIELFRETHPDWDIVLSTTTLAGRTRSQKLFGDLPVFYYPLDFSWMIDRALVRVRPTAIVLLELEIWPNFVPRAERRNIPVVLLNGRLSQSGFWWHSRLLPILRYAYHRIAAYGVQTDLYARRIAALGVDPARIHVTGTMKYDTVPLYDPDDRDESLARALGLEGATVLVGGSTHGCEEGALLDAFDTCRAEHPELRLVLVPRKPDRFDEVAGLVASRGYRLLRRSETIEIESRGEAPAEPPEVVVVDTFGELERVYRLAEVVFVGRSLEPLGGSNILEPAGCTKPILFGPHMDNFADVARGMIEAGGALRIDDSEGLRREIARLLDDPDEARTMGRRARAYLESRQGASQESLAILESAISQ